MIERTASSLLIALARQYPVVTVTGPRQSGKTTLCRNAFPDKAYVNLEQPDVRQIASEDPRAFLRSLPDGAILDEIQRAPELLSYVQTVVDEHNAPGQYILTGSEQFEVLNRVSQSLAGRTGLLRLLPFAMEEMDGHYPMAPNERLIYSGFYPRIHDAGLNPTQALSDYFDTYVQRDVRALANLGDLNTFSRFVRLCAGRCGQLLNLSSLATDAGISHTTARTWLSLLEAGFIAFTLSPFSWNISKRLVKSPKLYFYDVGLAAFLLGIREQSQVRFHPHYGALFENMVVVEALKTFLHRGRRPNFHFYRDSEGNEIDLLIEVDGGVMPIEIKSGETLAPDFFRGLQAFARLYREPPPNAGILVYGGTQRLERLGTSVVPIPEFHSIIAHYR